MALKKTRYRVALQSRPIEEVAIEQKHSSFFRSLDGLQPPWGLGGRAIPVAPQFKGSVAAVGSLNKFFGAGVYSAQISYRYRRRLEDTGVCDDRLTMLVDQSAIDNRNFIYNIIPIYIKSFQCYLAQYFDDEWLDVESDGIGSRTDARFGISHFGAATFLDEVLCRRASGLSPVELRDRVEGVVEAAKLINNGVYIIGSSQLLTFSESRRLSSSIKAAILKQ